MSQKHFCVMIAGLAKAGMEDYVKHYFLELMEHSRRDAGCLVYNIHQSSENPGEFMVYMLWQNEEAFKQHNQTPRMQEFKQKLAKDLFEAQSPKTYWQLIG